MSESAVQEESGSCASTRRMLLTGTATRAESTQTRLSPTITGWLALSRVLSRRITWTRAGLFSALNRCGSRGVTLHAMQAQGSVHTTNRTMIFIVGPPGFEPGTYGL